MFGDGSLLKQPWTIATKKDNTAGRREKEGCCLLALYFEPFTWMKMT